MAEQRKENKKIARLAELVFFAFSISVQGRTRGLYAGLQARWQLVDFAKLKRTYNESVATGQSDAPSRGLDFLDREQPRRLCEVLIAVTTALGEARSGCATPPLFSLRVWAC
jgi:hypothetical protein